MKKPHLLISFRRILSLNRLLETTIAVGPPKTGTTSIQCTLINNEKLLETDNFVFIGKASDCPASSRKGQRLFVEPKELSICVKSGVSECQEYHKLELILEGALERGQNVVFSAENAFIFGTHEVFKEFLMKRWNVKVVVTYRRYYEWLVSYYNSKYKPSLMRRDRADLNVWPAKGGKSIPTFDQILSGNFTKGNKVAQFNFNWYQDVITEFEKHYHDVVVLNMHDGRPGDDDVSESSILVKKFACDVMNAANTCKRGKVSALKNPSAKLYPDMLALAAYDENLFAWKKISRENVRKAILRYDGLGENVPLKCISKQHEDELLRASLRYEEEFLPKFYESPRGKVVHMRKFRDSTSTLFCNVDTEEALRDHHWTSFFNSLTDTNAVPWN